MNTPEYITDYPRKIIHFGPDPETATSLQNILNASRGEYSPVKHFASLNTIQVLDLPTYCHAVIIDIRLSDNIVLDAIKWIAETQNPVAVICLCQCYEDMETFKNELALVDDVFVLKSLGVEELCFRLERAIANRSAGLALRQDQELLAALLNNVPDAIYFKDRDCRFIRVNSAKATKHGQTPKEMIGKTDFDYFSEEHARLSYDIEQNIMRNEEQVVGKIEKLTFDDGSVCWVNSSRLALHDKLGRVIGTMGISRNITELKEAQDKLADEHRLLSAILNNVPDRIFVKNREGQYISSNKNHMRFLGVKAEGEVIGTNTYDHFPQEIAHKHFENDMEIMRTGQGLINSYEKRQNADSSESWFLTSKVPLIDDSGNCVGVVGISRDVTQEVANGNKKPD